MRRLFHILLSIAASLWLGGLVMLFLSVKSIFNSFNSRRELAGEAASAIFRMFNVYHLALSALCLLLTFGWWFLARSKRKMLAFFLFAAATVAAVYVTAVLNPQLEKMRLDAQTHTSRFGQLHGIAMATYLMETIFVLLAALVIPWAARRAVEQEPVTAALQI